MNSKSVLKSTVMLTVIVFIGKLIGFLKSSVMAGYFGANNATDELYLASGLMSNIVYALMTAVSLAFVPIYLNKKVTLGEKESSRFATNMVANLSIAAIIISLMIVIFAPLLAKVSAPSYSDAQLTRVTLYFRILAIGILFSLTTRLLSSILDAEKIYSYSALCGIIFSIVEIVCMILLHEKLGVLSICISIPIAYIIQNIFLRVRTRRIVKFTLKLSLKDADFSLLLAVAVPVLLGNSVSEINQLVDRLLAAYSIEGGVSALTFAAVLYQFVSALITGSIITVLFTELSESVAERDIERIRILYNRSITVVCLVLMPITIIACMNSNDVVKLAFGRGAFDENAVSLTALVLSLYVLDFIPNAIKGISTRVFYANNDTKTPMFLSVIAVLINIITSVVLTLSFGFIGIAVGTVISAYCSMGLQNIALHKKYDSFGLKTSIKEVMKIILSGMICFLAVVLIDQLFIDNSPLLRFSAATGVGFLIYLFSLVLLKCDQLVYIKNIIERKIIPKRSH